MRDFPLNRTERPVRLHKASTRGQPSWRFRTGSLHCRRHQRRNGADNKHPAPAEMRDDPGAGHADSKNANGKNNLVEREEASTIVVAGNLADIGGCDRHFASEADALHETGPEHLIVILRDGADEAHRGKQGDTDAHDWNAAKTFRSPTKSKCADRLTDKAHGKQFADLSRRYFPGFDQ